MTSWYSAAVSLFWCLCLFFCVPKEPKNTSLARSPALAYAVRISQDGTRIKFDELMPVRLSNQCKFILVRPVFLLYMILESVREDKAQRTRERRERARTYMYYDDCLTILEWKETARSLDTDLKSYVGTISLFTCLTIFMAEGLHRRYSEICKRV